MKLDARETVLHVLREKHIARQVAGIPGDPARQTGEEIARVLQPATAPAYCPSASPK